MSRHTWTHEHIEELRGLYASLSAQECADALGVSIHAVHHAVHRYGLSKTREWIVERSRQAMQRLDHPARQSRFQKGLIPHNKGKPHPTRGRAADTQFKKGQKPHTWNPVGHVRETKDGYLQKKLTETGVTRRDYVAIHHLVWRLHGGTIPPGHALIFVDGNKHNLDINNLALVPRAELMRRNSIHNHGPEVARMYQLIGVLHRKINERTKELQQ